MKANAPIASSGKEVYVARMINCLGSILGALGIISHW